MEYDEDKVDRTVLALLSLSRGGSSRSSSEAARPSLLVGSGESTEAFEMAIETVRDHGQVTIPEEIRRQLRLETGARLRFEVDAEGGIRLVPVAGEGETASGESLKETAEPGRVTEEATRAWAEERRFIRELIAKGPVSGGPRWTREDLYDR